MIEIYSKSRQNLFMKEGIHRRSCTQRPQRRQGKTCTRRYPVNASKIEAIKDLGSGPAPGPRRWAPALGLGGAHQKHPAGLTMRLRF